MKTKCCFCLLLLLTVTFSAAAETKYADPWEPLRFFIGKWEGTTEGQPGKGTSQRAYEWILGEKYIRIQNTSVYPAQANNPNGEKHEDLGIISFDQGTKSFVLRQFHVEGFVNQYRVQSISEDGKSITFETESIENIPPGWKARETYTIQGNDQFQETFELAEPGKEFAVYSKATYKRSK